MSLYTDSQVGAIITLAKTTLPLVQNKAERDRYMTFDGSMSIQAMLLYSIRRAVEYARGLYTDAEYNQVVAYLYSKCNLVEAIGIETLINPPSIGDNDTATADMVIYEFQVPSSASGIYPIAGDTSWVNPIFANRTVEVEYGNIPMSGVDMGDGSMYFTKPFSSSTLTFHNMTGGLVAGALLKIRAWKTGS